MIPLLIIILLALAVLVGVVFLLGFRLGGESTQPELAEVRLQAMQAERRLHDLTRSAFVSMAEAAQAARHPKP